MLSNWGTTLPPNFSGFAIPEPSSIALLGGVASMALRRRGERAA
ncbi:MAG: PEP-CTERM sorting domain-containing protein [Planctomycetota bacterium]